MLRHGWIPSILIAFLIAFPATPIHADGAMLFFLVLGVGLAIWRVRSPEKEVASTDVPNGESL